MANRLTHKYLTETATRTYASWSARQVASFHYFNPNGEYAAWKRMCNTIATFVDAGAVPSGFHLAYGSLNDRTAQEIIDIAMGVRKGKGADKIAMHVLVKMLREQTEKGYTRLGEKLLEE